MAVDALESAEDYLERILMLQEQGMKEICEYVKRNCGNKVTLLGPSAASLRKRKDWFRWQLLLKSDDVDLLLHMKEEIHTWMEEKQSSCYLQYELDG